MLWQRTLLASAALPHLAIAVITLAGRGNYVADSPDRLLQATVENPGWPMAHVVLGLWLLAAAFLDSRDPHRPGLVYQIGGCLSAVSLAIYGGLLTAWGLSIPARPSILGPILCLAFAVANFLLTTDRHHQPRE